MWRDFSSLNQIVVNNIVCSIVYNLRGLAKWKTMGWEKPVGCAGEWCGADSECNELGNRVTEGRQYIFLGKILGHYLLLRYDLYSSCGCLAGSVFSGKDDVSKKIFD